MIILDQFKEREMKLEELIKNENEIISLRNDIILLKQENKYKILDVYENKAFNDFKLIYETNKEDFAKYQFDIISNISPKTIVYREDKVGYPNNQSIVAFSLKEKPSHPNNIVYYEYDKENGTLGRYEAIKDFVKNTNKTIENGTKLNELKEVMGKYFSFVFEVEDVRIPKRYLENEFNEELDKKRKEDIINKINNFKNKDIDYDFSM